MAKSRLYIAYGSNLHLPQMAFRCPTAKVVGASHIKDYELLFRGGRNGAVATVEPLQDSHVPVLLWISILFVGPQHFPVWPEGFYINLYRSQFTVFFPFFTLGTAQAESYHMPVFTNLCFGEFSP